MLCRDTVTRDHAGLEKYFGGENLLPRSVEGIKDTSSLGINNICEKKRDVLEYWFPIIRPGSVQDVRKDEQS